MKKKNVAQSAHSDDVRDHVPDKESRNDQLERLARTFFGSSSSQHIRTVDGKVESNSIKHNNPGTDFRNQFNQFEANEDMSRRGSDQSSKITSGAKTKVQNHIEV